MATKIDEGLESALGLPSPKQEVLVPEAKDVTPSKPNKEETEFDNDFKQARESIKDMVKEGSDAIVTLSELARESESPRAFEVLSNLIKTVNDANMNLLDAHSKRKEMKKKEESEGPKVTNNNLIMSTEDVRKMLRDERDT